MRAQGSGLIKNDNSGFETRANKMCVVAMLLAGMPLKDLWFKGNCLTRFDPGGMRGLRRGEVDRLTLVESALLPDKSVAHESEGKPVKSDAAAGHCQDGPQHA